MRVLVQCCRLLLNSALLAVSLVSGAQAQVIFDNTATRIPSGSRSFTAQQLGNEVQVGMASQVNLLEIGVNQQGVAGTTNLQAFLYSNDGSLGTPGTELWHSPLLTNVTLSGGNDLIAFAVPNIAVPTIFTWTIQISNPIPVAAGLPAFDPPTKGTILHSWFGSPGLGWTSLDAQGANSHFMARITSVPEPDGLAILICLSASGTVLLLKRRR